MPTQKNTPCIKCGKERVKAESWSEHIGESVVTYTTYVCPDSECQKLVDEMLQKKKDKFEAIQNASMKRRKENKRNKKTRKQVSV